MELPIAVRYMYRVLKQQPADPFFSERLCSSCLNLLYCNTLFTVVYCTSNCTRYTTIYICVYEVWVYFNYTLLITVHAISCPCSHSNVNKDPVASCPTRCRSSTDQNITNVAARSPVGRREPQIHEYHDSRGQILLTGGGFSRGGREEIIVRGSGDVSS